MLIYTLNMLMKAGIFCLDFKSRHIDINNLSDKTSKAATFESRSFQKTLLDSVSHASHMDKRIKTNTTDLSMLVETNPEAAVTTQSSCSQLRSPVGLLSNPLSFHNRHRPAPVMRRILRDYPEVHQFPVSNREEIRAAVEHLKTIGTRLIIANGGDGTVQGVITEIWRVWEGDNLPQIAVMPGGRTNVISYDLNGRIRPREVLRRILSSYCQNCPEKIRERRLLKINYDDHAAELGFLISGAGLAAGIEECWSLRHRLRKMGLFGGLGTATWVLLRLLTTPAGKPLLPPRPAKITIDGKTLPDEYQQLLMITVNERFPVGVQPFWPQQKHDREPNLKVTVVRSGAKGLWWRTLPLAKGWGRFLPSESGYYSGCAQKIEVRTEQNFHLDGEIRAVNNLVTLNIELGPKMEFLTV